MGMLTQEDLKQIGEVVDERLDLKLDAKFTKFEERIVPRIVSEIVSQVGEMIEENVLPQFDRLENTLVTKDYLDKKLGTVNGKINVLVDVLHRNHTLSDEQRGIVHAA